MTQENKLTGRERDIDDLVIDLEAFEQKRYWPSNSQYPIIEKVSGHVASRQKDMTRKYGNSFIAVSDRGIVISSDLQKRKLVKSAIQMPLHFNQEYIFVGRIMDFINADRRMKEVGV